MQFFVFDEKAYLICELVIQGGDLDGKVAEYKKKKTRIPEAQVVEWIIQLLLAVQYMHDR